MPEFTVQLEDEQIEIFLLACERKIGLDNLEKYHDVEKHIMQQICDQLAKKDN